MVKIKPFFERYSRRGPPASHSPTPIILPSYLPTFPPSYSPAFLSFCFPAYLSRLPTIFLLSSCPSSCLPSGVPPPVTHRPSKPLRRSTDSHAMVSSHLGVGYVGGSRMCSWGVGGGRHTLIGGSGGARPISTFLDVRLLPVNRAYLHLFQ